MVHGKAENNSKVDGWDGCRLGTSEYWAERNTDLIHTISKKERWAGIYEDAPDDDRASGGLPGLAVNCACAALYMVSCLALALHFSAAVAIQQTIQQPSFLLFRLLTLCCAALRCALPPRIALDRPKEPKE